MVQCEMCGKEVASPKSTKIEGAILRVCQECSRFGAEIKSRAVERGGTKYQIKHKTGGTKRGVVKNKKRQNYPQMKEVDLEFNDKIRKGREKMGLSQVELAKELNERASLIKKLERGDVLPSEKVRKKIEKYLKISLLEDAE